VVEGVAVVAPDRAEPGEHGPGEDLAHHRVHLGEESSRDGVAVEALLVRRPSTALRISWADAARREGASRAAMAKVFCISMLAAMRVVSVRICS
jgi:hypothetical protein